MMTHPHAAAAMLVLLVLLGMALPGTTAPWGAAGPCPAPHPDDILYDLYVGTADSCYCTVTPSVVCEQEVQWRSDMRIVDNAPSFSCR
jgi:hypothetical protein